MHGYSRIYVYHRPSRCKLGDDNKRSKVDPASQGSLEVRFVMSAYYLVTSFLSCLFVETLRLGPLVCAQTYIYEILDRIEHLEYCNCNGDFRIICKPTIYATPQADANRVTMLRLIKELNTNHCRTDHMPTISATVIYSARSRCKSVMMLRSVDHAFRL